MKTNAIEWLNNNICPFNSNEQLKDGISFYQIEIFIYKNQGIHLAYTISKLLYDGLKDTEIKIRILKPIDKQSCIFNLYYCLQILKESNLNSLALNLDPESLHSVFIQNYNHLNIIQIKKQQKPTQIAQLIQTIYNQCNVNQVSSETNSITPVPRKPPKPAPKLQQDLFYVDESSLNVLSSNEQIEETAQQYKVLKPQNPYKKNIKIQSQSQENSEISHNSQFDVINDNNNINNNNNNNNKNNNNQKRQQSVKLNENMSSNSLVTPSSITEDVSDRIKQNIQTYFNSQTLGVMKEAKYQNQNNSSFLMSGMTPIKNDYSVTGESNKKIKQIQNEIVQIEDRIKKENIENTSQNMSRMSLNEYKKNKKSRKASNYNDCINVSLEDRLQLIQWLQEIRLIKNSAQSINFMFLKQCEQDLEEKLPIICADGVIFFDLLNRLNGKDGVIHGAIRNPKTPVQISHNYRRVMNYLQGFEKYNCRTIGIDPRQDQNAFWTLLLDIKNLYTVKDLKTSKLQEQDQSKIVLKNSSMISENEKMIMTAPSPKQQKQQQQSSSQQRSTINYSPGATYSKLHKDAKALSANKFEFGTPKQNTPTQNQNRTSSCRSNNSRWQSEQSKSNNKQSSQKMQNKYVSIEMILFVQNFLKEKYFSEGALSLEKDPTRNGEFLADLLRLPYNIKKNLSNIKQIIEQSLEQVYEMVEQAMIPAWCAGIQSSDIMQESRLAYGLYWWLLKHTGRPQTNIEFLSGALPYKIEEIEALKRMTLQWCREISQNSTSNLQFYQINQVQSFPDFIAKCQTGVLLCEIVSIITKKSIEPAHKVPQTQLHCLNNIIKSLSGLRVLKVGKKFLWKEREIYDGDQFIILGLFEDIRRFNDGQPERSGLNYFIEGPYLKQILNDRSFDLPKQQQQNSSQLTTQLMPISKVSIQNAQQQIPFQNQYSPQSRQDEKTYSLLNKVNRSLNFENNANLLNQNQQRTNYQSPGSGQNINSQKEQISTKNQNQGQITRNDINSILKNRSILKK